MRSIWTGVTEKLSAGRELDRSFIYHGLASIVLSGCTEYCAVVQDVPTPSRTKAVRLARIRFLRLRNPSGGGELRQSDDAHITLDSLPYNRSFAVSPYTYFKYKLASNIPFAPLACYFIL